MTNELKKAVAAMGGVTAFARALGVDRTAAYKWRRGVPADEEERDCSAGEEGRRDRSGDEAVK